MGLGIPELIAVWVISIVIPLIVAYSRT